SRIIVLFICVHALVTRGLSGLLMRRKARPGPCPSFREHSRWLLTFHFDFDRGHPGGGFVVPLPLLFSHSLYALVTRGLLLVQVPSVAGLCSSAALGVSWGRFFTCVHA